MYLRQLKRRTAITTAGIYPFLASPEGEEGWCYTLEHAHLRLEVALQKQQDAWDTASCRLSCPGHPNSRTVLVCTVQAPHFPEGSCSRSAAGDPEPGATKEHSQTCCAHTSAPCASLFLSSCKTADLLDCPVCRFQLTSISQLSSRARSVAPRSSKWYFFFLHASIATLAEVAAACKY